ncbi:hypothetical protein K439DRAFT_1347600, partial [Ramaria rubella]
SQCNVGEAQCCNVVQKASNNTAAGYLDLVGIAVNDVDVLVGLGCSPILGSDTCTREPVCCTNNNYNGLVNIGCSSMSR